MKNMAGYVYFERTAYEKFVNIAIAIGFAMVLLCHERRHG